MQSTVPGLACMEQNPHTFCNDIFECVGSHPNCICNSTQTNSDYQQHTCRKHCSLCVFPWGYLLVVKKNNISLKHTRMWPLYQLANAPLPAPVSRSLWLSSFLLGRAAYTACLKFAGNSCLWFRVWGQMRTLTLIPKVDVGQKTKLMR